ncbi:hypothetical protein QN224_14310 [Sinorhizobium sp. 8-89]|uniref:hypothetical protein n=1 Tax=Sinorhizobium sp. 7-81 TaxID=3049087 RepID=UPI0024C2F341|nr:hypothetical protein [Sinorhizobium sp. 7-81]MDK1386580.1 hypothetical protein [Sinorhizobium sp. 7-81]
MTTSATSSRRYHVQPLLVTDLASQCAAHFLNWFSRKPLPVIAKVVKIGVHGSGGWVDQVDAWFELCEADLRIAVGGGQCWNTDVLGPWVYEDLAVADVTRALVRHVGKWNAASVSHYGRLAEGANTVADDPPS